MKITSLQTFGAPSIADYYYGATDAFSKELREYPGEKILGTDIDQLVEYFSQKYSLSPIEIDDSRQLEVDKVIKKENHRTIFDDIVTKDVTYARIIFPLKPGIDLSESFKYHTQTHTVKAYEFDFNEHNWSVSIEVLPEAMQSSIEEHQTLFTQRTAEINQRNQELKQQIREQIEQRRKSLESDDVSFEAMVKKVTIPLKMKPKPDDYEVPLRIRESVVKMSEPPSSSPKELILTNEQLNSILGVIDSDGKNFENTPETFNKLDEPDLRNIILSHLNLYFPDDATGETFVGLGKSDIRLKVFEGLILLAECKYWHGDKEFGEAIEQLFLYLTWRHNYGIIILFSKNEGFSVVLENVKTALQSHQSYKGGFTELDKSHFRTTHNFPDDPKKQVEIHTLVYNLHHGTK